MTDTMHGIDVSHWQAGLDLAEVDAQFVIIKATEGTTYADPTWDAFYVKAAALGLLRGLYHFYRGGGAAEADWFLATIDGCVGDALLALDVEGEHSGDVAGARAFLDRVHEVTGVRPVLYTSAAAVAASDWTTVAEAGYALWVARWEASEPGDVTPWNAPVLWQFSDAYSTGGWLVDGDLFYGDETAWARLATGQGGSTMTRNRDDGAAWAKGKVGYVGYGGLCLQFTREAYAIPSKYGDAAEAWDHAQHKHKTSSTSGIPYGVPIWFDSPESSHGHVAVYVGDGRMITTHASTNTIGNDAVSQWIGWGYRLLGWSDDINGVTIPSGDDNKPSGGLTVDGIWGSSTTKRIQQVLGTDYHDGEVSRQNKKWKGDNPGLTSGWEWLSSGYSEGSQTIEAIQERVGAKVDGLIGPATIKAMQEHFGTTVDGVVSHPSKMVEAMQKRLNDGKF